MISNKAPITAPWGAHKFVEPRTYAPKFHQPQGLRHIDQNSTLDLGWDDVKPREKPKTVVEEMKETLENINGLLNDLGSRVKTTSHIARNVETKKLGIEKPMRDSTINSCLESLCDDISAVTDQLKQLSPKPNHRQQEPCDSIQQAIKQTETVDTITTDRPYSRKSSISQISSIVTSVDQTKESPPTPTETESSENTVETPTRKRSCSGSVSQTQSGTYHRGSEISQEVSMHRSNFRCIADLCGYGDSISNTNIKTTRRFSKSKSSFDLTTRPDEQEVRGVYFTEYPPQRGSERFDGIFHDDITALLDDTARGLLVL